MSVDSHTGVPPTNPILHESHPSTLTPHLSYSPRVSPLNAYSTNPIPRESHPSTLTPPPTCIDRPAPVYRSTLSPIRIAPLSHLYRSTQRDVPIYGPSLFSRSVAPSPGYVCCRICRWFRSLSFPVWSPEWHSLPLWSWCRSESFFYAALRFRYCCRCGSRSWRSCFRYQPLFRSGLCAVVVSVSGYSCRSDVSGIISGVLGGRSALPIC